MNPLTNILSASQVLLDLDASSKKRVFEQAGLLSRNHFESGKSVFELNEGQHHDHLVCLDCGKVEEFYDAEIEKRQHAVAKEKGFCITDHALSLYATCTKTNCPNKTSNGRTNG